MKKTMKRWLAMLLAVLMVMGTLPTSAWAARREEEFAEQPVIGEGDGVTDTLGKHDDGGEYPVDPVDPSDPPADLNEVTVEKGAVQIATENLSSQGAGQELASAVATGADASVIMIIPRFVTAPGSGSTAISIENMTTTGFQQDIVTPGSGANSLKSFASMPFYYAKTGDMTLVSKIAIDWDGKITITSNGNPVIATGLDDLGVFSDLKSGKLSEYAQGKKFYYPRNHEDTAKQNQEIPHNTEGLPFTVIMGGSGGFGVAHVNLPVTAQPLKVEIETKDVVKPSNFQYNTTAGSQVHFTPVKITNNTGKPLSNVTVTIYRAMVTNPKPDGYPNVNVTTDMGSSNIRAANGGNGNGNFAIDVLYGLIEKWDNTETDGKYQSNVTSQQVLSNLSIPATNEDGSPGSITVDVAGTNRTSATRGGLNGIGTSTTTRKYDWWGNYSIVASTEIEIEGETKTVQAQDNGGINWLQKPEMNPKVRLVYGDGANKGEPINDHTGAGLQLNNSANTSANKNYHTVIIQGKTLTWQGTYYGFASETEMVGIGQSVRVDGVVTNQKAVITESGYIDVPMYQVTMADDPDGKAGDVLGHYMWDTTVPDPADGGSSIKKVSYAYYPETASVGVYAKKDGFSNWENATSGALTNPAGSSLEVTGDSATTVGGHLTVNSDVTVTAHYVKPITLVTTYDGELPGNNTPGDLGNRSSNYVFSIEVRDTTNNVVASYVAGGSEPTKITEQTATNAWLLDLDAGRYTLYINNRRVDSVDTTDLPTVAGTNYNYVVEMVGVTPKVAEGTDKEGSTLTLPDDLNPGRARGNVIVTGNAKNTDGSKVLYYPKVSSVAVSGNVAEGDNLSKLTYPTDDDPITTAVETDRTWHLNIGDTGSRTMLFKTSGTHDLVATFSPSDGTAKVTVKKDTGAFTGLNVRLSTSKDAIGDKPIILSDTTPTASGVYSATAAPGKYYIWIGNACTEQELTVTAGDPPSEATVQYWTVSVSTDGNGKATVTANDKKDLVIGGADAASAEATGTTPATVVVIEGTSVTWAFGQANDYYEADKWEGGANHNAITATVGTDTVKSQKALFKQKMANVTVTVKLNDQPKGVGKAVKVTVNGVEKTVAADANETAAVLTFSVPERAAGYTVTVDGAPKDWSTGPVYAPTGEDRPSNADVNFYSLTVEADQTLASSAKVGQSTTDPATADQNSSSVNYLTGTTVYIKAVPGGDNYAFSEWEVQDSKGSKPNPDKDTTSVTMTTETHLKAIFTKPRYDTYLVLNLNGDPVKNQDADNMGKPKDEDISKIEFIQTKGDGTKTTTPATFDTEKDAWTVNVISANGTGEWSITTTTGTYTANSAGDSATPTTKNLYSVIVVPDVGKGNDAVGGTNVPKIGDNKLRAILETSGNVALAANPKTGYDFSKWVVVSNYGEGSEAEADITAGGTYAAIANKLTFTSYTANAELVLRPKFTFKATVKVVYDGKPHTADSIELKTGGGSVTSKSENEFTNLVPGTTYNVWVNGFDTGVNITAPATETITMRKISVAKLPTDATATVQIKLGAGSYVTDGAVYVPNGVTVTTTAPTVSIKATENADYKLDTTAWTVASDGDVAAITTATAAETTVVSATDKKITADVVATAHFTRQYDLTTYVSNGNASITPRSNSKFEGGTGDGTASGSANTKTIAKDTYVKVTFTGGPGETLDSWTLAAGGAGKWYAGDTPDAEGATWTDWATTAPTKAVESFYFKPSADSTITAAVGTKPYPIKVRVYLDGTLLTKDSAAINKLVLGTTEINKTTDWHAGADGAEGYWEVALEPNNTTGYTLSTDVINKGNGTAVAATSSTANIKFDVTAGEAGGLQVSVKYWTITVETSGHGNASTKDGDRTAATDYTATPAKSSDSHIVENGHTISWGTANPETHYEFKAWQTQQTVDGELKWVDIATAAVPSTATAAHHLRARFGRKIATLIVTFRKNGVQDTYTGDNPYTLTVTSADVTQAGSTSTYTATVDQGVAYSITASRTGYVGGDYTTTFTATKADPDPVYVDYYDVTAKTFVKSGGTAADARGDAKLIWVKADNSTAELGHTDYKNEGGSGATTSFPATVLTGTKVQWQAYNAADNYSFANWDDNTNLTANPYPATAAAITSGPQEHTAYFTKDKYNTYLYLTVNGDAYGTAAADDDNIKSVKLVTAKNGETEVAGVTVEYVEAKTLWAAEGVPQANEPWWRVETVDGGVYYKEASRDDKSSDVAPVIDATGDTTKDKAVVREPLFGVVIERGAGNDNTATYTPTLQAQVGSDPKTRIVTEAEVAATVDLNKKSGYTWSKWLSKQSASPANTDDLDTTNHGKYTTTTTADGTFALVKGYTAPATGDDKDLHIKPVYTYEVTVRTVRVSGETKTPTAPGGNVVVNGDTLTASSTGTYAVTGLTPGDTQYTINVNGFDSSKKITTADAGKTVDVKLFSVTVDMEDTSNAALTAGDTTGRVYVKLGATAIGTTDKATSVYLPEGAKTTAATNDATTIHLAAAAGTAYRLHNKDNADTDAYDEILWSVPTLAETLKMTIDTTDKTGDQTPNNLTIGGADGMQADVTVTAYFLRQYDLTVSAVTTEDKAATNSEVKLTADPKGLGTVMPGTTTTGQSVKVTKVDAKTYIKVEYVHGVGETFLGWSYAEADGDLYSALKADDTVDTTKRIAPAAIAAVSDKTSPVYFVPKKDGATLKAVVKPAEYTVQVKVNLDNTEYPYNNGDLKVWLYTDETTPKKVTELTYNTTDKVFKGDVLPGTYRVYVNGADLASDPVFTEAAKNISFNADEAEGTVAGGGDNGKAKLKKEINYYHVNLAVNPANTGAIVNKVGFGSTMPNGSTGTASKIYLAKTVESANNGVQPIDIIAGAYDDNNKTHFRFDKWEQTGPNDGATTPTPITIGEFAHTTTQEQETYKLPNEATLTATNDDGSFKITTGNQLTLTATFVQQYKVKVQLKDSSLGSYAEAKQKKNAAATTYTEIEVNVDKGSSAYIKGTVTGVDYAFAQWSIKADNGKGKFANNETLGGEGVIGYLAEDTFTPEQDSILELELWQAGAISKDGWEYDKADATKSVAGSGELKKMLWTPNNGQTPTEVWVVKTADLTSTNKGTKLTENTHYTVTANADGTTTFEFDEAYLKGLDIASYTATFVYTLGAAGHKINYTGWTKTGAFSIKATKQDLTKVDIQVKDGELPETPDDVIHGSATANVDEEDRNAVRYEDHTVTNVPKADLLYQWYYSDKEIVRKIEGSSGLTVFKDDPAGTANAKTAMEKGEAFLTNATATYGIKKLDGQTADNLSIASNDTLKGKYVFALVWVDDSSDVAQGAVITNAISVDYDATVSVYEDGTDADHLIQEAQKDNYTVYLWDAASTETFPADPAATGSKAIPANYSATDKKYHTEDSNLNAKKTYHVYVQEVEGDKTHYLILGGNTPTTITRTTNTADVYYYTVTTEAVSKETSAKNNIADATAASGAPGETFDATPTFSAKTGNDTAIPSGNGVLQGSHVKANANKLEGKNVGWEQDYDLTWMNKGATGDYTDVTGTNKVQTSTTAVSVGYEHSQNLTGVLTISGRLTQNTYTLTGIIRDVNNTGSLTGGKVASATLTKGEGDAAVKYNHTSITLSGFNNGVVSFVVPRGTYKLNSVEASDSTHKGHWNGGADKVWPLGHLNDAEAGEVTLAELTAQTPNATVADQFTIYVAATLRQTRLTDSDNNHDTGDVSRTDVAVRTAHTAGTDETPSKDLIVFNYDPIDKVVTVTNTGNTTLKLKSVLTKKGLTAADTTFAAVTLTNGADTNGVTFKYTHTVAADGTETTLTTPEALTTDATGTGAEFTLQPGEARKVTIHITDKLENADDVTYRLDFTSVDGRPVEAPATPAKGPTVGYTLNIEIKPITIRRVTAEDVKGTFKVQHHWLMDDALNNNQPDTDATYSAGGEAHTWAAETLKEGGKKTLMDKLVKQGQTVDGVVATDDPTKSDIKYRWYVADADAGKPTINTTTGELTFPNNKGHEVTANPDSNGTAYTPTEADHGKMLYLVAVGQRNATNAVMTPDEARFAETPVPIPYPATITLYENWVESDGTVKREQVKEADKGNYTVWLWDVTGGKTDELDTTNTARAIEAEAVAGEDGTYKTDVVLYPDHEYQVWTSAAKTADGTAFYLRNTGITIASVDQKAKDVNYYLVDVADTELSQNTYATELADANIVDNSQYFYKTTDLTGDLKKPVAKMPDKGAATATLDVTSNYVLNNTEVTFGFGDRTLDYDLNWGGGMTAVTDKPTDTVSHKLTYKDAPKAAVTTELELRLYDVTAKVNGSTGKVEYFSMVLTDGEKPYTFSSKDNKPNNDAILGVTTSATDISVTQSVVFHLPKAGPYKTKAAKHPDSAAKLLNYTKTDGSQTENLTDENVDTFTFDVTVSGACQYAVNLQGDGIALNITDNIPTATQIGGVQLEVSTPTATAKTATASIEEKEGAFVTDHTDAVQTIKLYYNSYTDAIPVTLTFSNPSKHDESGATDLQNVTFVKTDCTAKPGGGDSITIDTDAGKTEVTGTAGLEIPTVEDGKTPVTKKVTLNIQPGLTVGTTYTFKGTASFDDGKTPLNQATTTYTLNVEIVPLPFETVTTADDGSTNGKEYTVNPSYKDTAITSSTKDSGADDNTNLTYGTDYTYKWVSSANDVTLTSADLHWDAATGTVTVDNSVDCKGNGKETKNYTPHPDDQGRKLYLVIYAKQGTNATGAAISLPITQTYDGIVYINNDGDRLTDPDTTNHADPGYAVQFIGQGEDNPIKGVWKAVETGKYAYVSEKGLTPGKEYTVKVSRIPGETTPVMVELSKKLTGVKIGKTLEVTGTEDADKFTNVTQADYFTVNAVNFINEEYQTGTGETFAATITPTITIGTDHAELANHTPVLSGQSVAAKAPAMADPNADKAWTQDYTLTWRNTTGNNKDITADDKTNLTDETNNAYKGQSATAAIADGAYAYGTVSAKTFIGGRLDQITYTIVGTIHGPTGNTQQVKNVTLTSDTTPAVIYYSDANTAGAGQTGIQSGAWTKDNNDGKHNDGDQVTFTVVKGTYTVTGYEDTNFTIRKVTVEGTDVDSTPRNQKIFTKDVKELDADKRIFDIYLEATGPKLTVNDKVTTTITATSELPDHNHQFADNNSGAHYYYKQLGSDGVFTLELSNPGNVDLKLKAPEVYKLDTGTTYTDMQAALTGKTALTNLTVKDGTRDIVKFENLPAANDDVLVGKSVSHDGTTLTNAGTITVSKDVYNKDDAIYVVKFASQYTTTDGSPAGDQAGPTVYYVLDLQVEPLPIKKVTAETDPNATDGTLRLKDFVATGDNANDGLNSVEVDDDLDADTPLKGAKDAGLVDGDISYVWYSAPTTMTEEDVRNSFAWNAAESEPVPANTNIKKGTQTNNGKTYKPSEAEQGLNFYLVAYRTDADKNASEFAVSDAVYAQVTIAMEAHRTGKVNKSDTEATSLLTEVNISTMVGEDKKTSNADTVTVTGVADNGNVLTFNATKTDVIAAGATDDDPAAAKWYFKSWAVKPLTGDELDATDTSIETPVGGERLTMNYTATGKATVIGYFDKLPELKEDKGYNVEAGVADNKADRTFHYEPNDGSGAGKVQIWIQPVNGNTWKNDNSAENKKPKQLTAALMIPPAAGAGAQGDYELTKTFLDNNLWQSDDSGDYRITFFDMERGAYSAITATNDGFEGTPREGGYAGYDRSVIYSITEGEKTVIAKVTNSGTEAAPVYWGQVKITNTALTDNENGPGDTATLATQGGSVRLFAIPKDGYAFAGWSKPDNEPNSKGKFGNTADAETPYTGVRQTTETVIATFRKGDFTPQADAKTSVYYGDDELQETGGKLVVSVTKDKDTSVTQDFTYDLATETELTAYLNGAARPDNAYTKDGVEVVPGDATKNTNVVPTWLDVKKDDTDNTKVNFTVKANTPATGVNVQKTTGEDGKLKDREDELVVYLKVTETHTGESKIVPVTIDVMTSKLEIATAGTAAEAGGTLGDKTQPVFDGNAYLALFEAATNATYPGEGRKPDHEEKVYYDYFAYTNVHNENNPTGNIVDANNQTGDHAANAAGKNRWDKTTGAANEKYGVVTDGYWTVAPVAFDGTGPNGYVAGEEKTNAHDYKFTFHYTGDPDDTADDYNYKNAEITLTIPALVPEMSLKFADTLKTTTQGGDPKALLTLTKGTHSGEVTGDGYVKDDADNHAPISLAYANEANRKDEHLTYLDEEPVFHVTLQKIGNLKRVELSAADVDGFETELPTITIDPNATTQTAEFDVKLTHMKDNAKLWAGTHTIKITAKGYYDDATGAEKFITATYELEIVIDPRLITAVDVTTEYNKTEPTDVTPTIEGDPTLNDKGEDTKGNTPIKDATVTWETEDAKNPVPVKETVTVEIDPNYKIVPDDIKPETELNGKNDKDTPEETGKNPDPNTVVTPEEPAEDKTDGGKITITQLHPILMFNDQKEGDDNSKAGPAVNHVRHLTSVKVGSDPTALGKVLIDLGAYSSDVYDVDVEVKVNDFAANGGVLTPELPEGQLLWPQIGMIAKDGKTHYVMDLTGLDTSKAMAYVLRLEAKGTEKDGGAQTILATYELHLRVTPNSPPPSGGGEVCPCKVFYHVGLHGTTTDATVEDVSESNRPSKIPTVTALDGYAFRGWSLTNPATLKQGEKIELVDPKTVTVKGDAMTFYAVIVERPFHEHYVIGYPNGNFGPADNINRASVATIIARAILPDFVEGANYGNPGGYSDVSGHWAESAIAYCSKFDVFKGYTDGTFRPDQPITRQEFATVIARLDGELTAKDIPFDDIDEAGDWAMNGIYTSYEKGWVNGYTDGTFKPLNNIRRDEAVKVFNAYLNRGVDADGLADLHEYVHTGVASNNTENGVDEYMTWPDVPKGHWAYYEIVEAANDHEFTPDFDAELGYTLPEHWEKCWIDERWRYGDGPSGGDSAAMVSAGFQVWLH